MRLATRTDLGLYSQDFADARGKGDELHGVAFVETRAIISCLVSVIFKID